MITGAVAPFTMFVAVPHRALVGGNAAAAVVCVVVVAGCVSDSRV
ncbi:hypothetical protein Rhow_000890 [Rhodococcus wratislaviensis]|uniref:Uncharacterized protein n=1 Tax=Rhodococcus wratislaviensis TaxID=44752 RepID=A0A402C328_RHOWR|nr:hypothetical protein Rhow_000890 [Rhodococcus wratislaviensis]